MNACSKPDSRANSRPNTKPRDSKPSGKPLIDKPNAHALLARKVRFLRFLRGWTQEDLAIAAGLHRSYVSVIERGASNLSLNNVERLAEALEVDVAELFVESPNRQP